MIPEPFEFALLCLIAARLWKLIGDDRILDRPREWLLDRVETRGRDSVYWGDFIICPWCAGFWVSGLTYAAWVAILGELNSASDVPVGLGVWFAISGVVGLFGLVVERLK